MVSDGAIYPELLESFVRDHLDKTAHRYIITCCMIPYNFKGAAMPIYAILKILAQFTLDTGTV